MCGWVMDGYTDKSAKRTERRQDRQKGKYRETEETGAPDGRKTGET